MRIIGIITALSAEMRPVYGNLGQLVGSREFFGGTVYHYVDGDRVFYVASSGIGEIYAAATTQLLITEYKAEVILNFGLVGSLSAEYGIGDLVAVKSVVHHQFDLRGIGAKRRGQYQGRPTEFWDVDKDTLAKVQEALPEKLQEVVLASGDQFVCDNKTKMEIVKWSGAEICDMEGAGIIIVAEANKVPAILIKAVSDNADDNAIETYEKSVSDGIYHYRRIIKELVSAL